MGDGHMIDRRCPRDGAALVSDGEYEWCSLIGCNYGLDDDPAIARIGPPTDEERIEVDHIDGLDVTITVEPAPTNASPEESPHG